MLIVVSGAMCVGGSTLGVLGFSGESERFVFWSLRWLSMMIRASRGVLNC